MKLYARMPDHECPWARVIVPKRQPEQFSEVMAWFRETYGPRTILRPYPPNNNLYPDRPAARWALLPLRHPRLQLHYRGIAIFDLADCAMLMLRFDVDWSVTMARIFWSRTD